MTDEKTEEALDKEKELAEAEKLADERLDDLKYLQADFDNYRKKFEKEKEAIIQLANENLASELLAVLDDFESAVKNDNGLEMLYKKFLKILGRYGLEEIQALGKMFDPNFHEAVSREKSDKGEGMILEELQKGYVFNGKVLRPSKVKISIKQDEEKGEDDGEGKNNRD